MSSTSNIIENLAGSLGSIQRLITYSSWIMGLTFLMKGIMALKNVGESKSHMSGGHNSMKEPVFYLVSGTMLAYLPTAIQVFLTTIFGSNDILAYSGVSSVNPVFETLFGSSSQFGKNIVLFVQTFGLIAFIRGWLIFARSGAQGGGHQQNTFGKALMHIGGGVLALNIVKTIQILNDTLYGTS